MTKEKKTSKTRKKVSTKKKSEADAVVAKEEALTDEKKIEVKGETEKPLKEEVKKSTPKKTKRSRKTLKKSKEKVIIARGKRKEAVARATIRSGKGVVRVNSVNLDSLGNKFVREIIREPIRYVGADANNVNISVNVFGGGSMGQAQAARVAIANALVLYFGEDQLKEKFISIDRSLIVEDTRRVEPKKYKGPKARARYQKSYR
jgi:small subunit ribosomal protein S9